MMLAMRRESEHHHHNTVATATADTTAVTQLSAATNDEANILAQNGLGLSTSNVANTDSLNTPSTPLLNLGRSPLHFTAPPPPPISVQTGPQFGFYTPTPSGSSSYFHHYTHVAPTYTTSSNNTAANGSYTPISENSRSTAHPAEELEEFVDIFQVQHLLLDHSVANGNQPPPRSLMPTSGTASATTTLSSVNNSEAQSAATTSSTLSSIANIAKPQPRPRLNLQKASEYAAQHQADSPSSRRMLLDYPSPYLYGNHYHSSPSEDLVALWFGSNGSGMLC